MKNETKNHIGHLLKNAVAVLLAVIFGILLMKKCGYLPEPQPIAHPKEIENARHKDTIRSISAFDEKRHIRIDSNIKLSEKADKAQIEHFNWSVSVSPDTCEYYMKQYKKLRDFRDSLLTAIIATQDSSLTDQKRIVATQQKIIQNDSLIIEDGKRVLQDTVKHFNKAFRRAKWKWFGIGFVSGYGVREGVNVVKQLKP